MAAYSYVIGGDHDFSDPDQSRCSSRRATSAGVAIGDGAWIGAGAKILDGVTIGDARGRRRRRGRPRDVPPRAIAVGIPARVVSMRGGAPARQD